ncbi:CCR4-Not complex 3'-5'-exoribonuclease subunit Ccr4-like isoform X2 [Patiria miniata]|uniref:Endonuclease/exonuclease/phosphatase domain-containing protein n=1 Tax=Patiria miniata TaxID=46514 RepID=A0A914BMP5_PATMI|nr:CCR4-Not complex 3'-5'-exoribonuclease subunit Ccr4-like isoform X2 [Patiria miniata]
MQVRSSSADVRSVSLLSWSTKVNSRYYDDVLRQDMQRRGYAGCYFMRPEDDTVDIDKDNTDGSATFYRDDRFQLVKEECGQFKHLFEKESENCQLPEDAAVSLPNLIDSSRVYIFTLLRCLKTKSRVAVGNIHTSFDFFTKMDLTTLEIAFAINGLVEFAGGVGTPHILCGDFNQEPHHPGYQLLHDGSLNKTMTTYLRDFKSGENGKVPSLVDVFPSCFKHNSRNLKSAYEAIVGHDVPFSNFEDSSAFFNIPKRDKLSKVVQALFDGTPTHPKVRKTDPEAYGSEKYVSALDYVWYSSDSLHCEAVLKMIDEDLILPLHACPNAVFPSDHLPIKAKFAFLKSSGSREPELHSAL